MSQPPHGTEVFISKIPREASDSQLKAFCEMAGEVYAMRVPKDRESNTNKGYCFCVFKNREAAEKAMTILEGREVKDFPGRRVNVVPSIVKNKLYIGQMPRDITREELDVLLKAEVVGLEKIELMMDKETNQARGFGFIAFYNNAAATMALRKLSRPEFRLRGHQVQVMWADPKRDEIGTEKVKSIYVGNLPEHYTENDLRSIFTQYGTIDRVTLLYMPDDVSKLRNYAFITYTDRSSAVRAVSEAENNKKHTMADKELLVHMAKPHTQREDGMGGMGMIRGYGSGGYGYHPRGYGPPGRGDGSDALQVVAARVVAAVADLGPEEAAAMAVVGIHRPTMGTAMRKAMIMAMRKATKKTMTATVMVMATGPIRACLLCQWWCPAARCVQAGFASIGSGLSWGARLCTCGTRTDGM
ncbi:hypothetical protein Vretifemale_3170 [Volvox reticuliferus]|uniref:RRM domain-containing protein n=1 Tax=Volvox reticuliferus TaxID=1737510 RepID=A0A8J4BZZ0_9CHLO|nr:hypothetical protein Vretifemale_3170 [Volvox reticuliferus]